MSAAKDYTGQVFGQWLVLERVKMPSGNTEYKCKCSCGNTKQITGNNLSRGKSTNCGCVNQVMQGDSKTRLGTTWRNMNMRCSDNTRDEYKYYGGRGITVCELWQKDFKAFKEWALSNGYEDHLTIDRIDNYGTYEPDNCRWVTMAVQNSNKRTPTQVKLERGEV